MNEAEARAYLSAQLPGLRAPCPRSKDAFMKGLPLGDTMHWYDPKGDGGWPCALCGGTGEVARDWHGSELQLALRPLGWSSYVTCVASDCAAEVWRTSGSARRPAVSKSRGDTPDEALCIAAALALRAAEEKP